MATATTDPITIKLDRLFAATDTDGDGYVDWDDYQRVVDRCLNAYKIDRNDRRARALLATHQMQWMELLRHGDGNTRLSREQYHQAVRVASVDTSRFNSVEGVPHAVFDVVDTDGDNAISADEFKRYLEIWGTDAADAAESFAKLDLDGDGDISRQEFLRAFREFFYSPDPDSAGSLLFGRASA